MKILLFGLLLGTIVSCTKAQKLDSNKDNEPKKKEILTTYLALGDSYTIGESVPAEKSYPYQIKDLLSKANIQIEKPTIIATTGWTTTDLLAAIDTAQLTTHYTFVTLLIGVNNQYRGYDISIYRKEFKTLLDKAIKFANGDKNKVFVISIPDWGVTPFAKNDGRSAYEIAQEIDAYNAFAKQTADSAGVSFTDITPASRNVVNDASLVADDGLHPSGKMYAQWAEAVAPKIIDNLK